MHYSTEESTWITKSVGNINIVTSCVSFDVGGFSQHLLAHNSSFSFGEDSDSAKVNSAAGSGDGGGGGFEENTNYWNNIVSLLDYSSVYAFENV